MKINGKGTFRSFIVVWVFIVFSQGVSASDDGNGPLKYNIGFRQNLNSYKWLSDINYTRTFYSRGLLSVSEKYNSSLLRLSRANQKWKDDHRLKLNLFWPFSPGWGIKSRTSVYNFSDRLSGFVSDINTNWWDLGLVLRPLPAIEVNAGAGFKYDSRFSQIDRGSTYLFDIKTEPINVKDYYNQFSFVSRGDKFSVRKNNDLNFDYQVKKYFQNDTYDSLSVFWTKKRRDNYDQISPLQLLIESLQENIRGFENELGYGLTEGIRLKIRTFFRNRQTSVGKFHEKEQLDSRSKKEMHTENEIGTVIDKNRLAAKLTLSYITDTQKNDVPDSLKSSKFSKYFYYISPDFESSRLSFSGATRYSISEHDTLKLNGSVSIFRYDTPENNMDDRDEFRLNFNLSEILHFNDKLKLIFNSGVNLYHLVYIYSERSANNNWMRIFRLDPRVVYRPTDKITFSNHVQILANYVDYDYDTGTSATDTKSYVFRRFAIDHFSSYQLTRRTKLTVNYKLELEENGKLDWDRWTEILLNNRESHWFRSNINFNLLNKFTIAPGIIFFKRTEKQADNFPLGFSSTSQGGNIVSFGPTLLLKYEPHSRLFFKFEGMRRSVSSTYEQNQYINHFDVSLTWYH